MGESGLHSPLRWMAAVAWMLGVGLGGLSMAQAQTAATPVLTQGQGQDPARVALAATPRQLPSAIPVQREAAAEQGPTLTWPMGVLAAGLALAGGVLFVRQRGRRQAPETAMAPRRVASVALTSRHSVHEIVWNGRRLLVGCAERDIRLLAQAPAPTSTEAPSIPDAPSASVPAGDLP